MNSSIPKRVNLYPRSEVDQSVYPSLCFRNLSQVCSVCASGRLCMHLTGRMGSGEPGAGKF